MKIKKNAIAEREPMVVSIDGANFMSYIEGELNRYKPIAAGIEKLRTISKTTIPWDDLYEALDTGDLCTAMAKYWAEKNFLDWEDVEVKNQLRERFSFLPRWTPYPKAFIKREKDGSFNVSKDAIIETYRGLYERIIDADIVEKAEKVCSLLNELKFNSAQLNHFFIQDSTGGYSPNWGTIAKKHGRRR